MKTGQDRYTERLRRGIRMRQGQNDAQLYVRRRTAKRGGNRVLLTLPAHLRYALCVFGSYRPSRRGQSVSQEATRLIWEALRRRLGPDVENILEDAYEAYTKECAEEGQPNIFATATDA